MKKIKKNEILNKNSLFLLNNPNNIANTSYLSYLKSNINIIKEMKSTKKILFRNTNFLKHSKLQSYLLRLGYLSYENNSKIKKKSKLKNLQEVNSTFKTPLQETKNKSTTNLSKNNYRILKGIFPNLSEIKLYSNFPLYPFNEKDYNNDKLIKREKKNSNIKKKIYNYYCKKVDDDIINTNIISDDIINDKGEKNNPSNINKLNLIKNKNENNNLSRKSIKSYLEGSFPLKITKVNLNNKYIFLKNESKNLNKNPIADIFKNKEINKYLKIRKILPNINNKEGNNYKFVKIKKNNSFVNSNLTNDFMNNINSVNFGKDYSNGNNYSFSHQTIKIKSVISRNKIASYKNNKIYEDKGTDTNEDK